MAIYNSTKDIYYARGDDTPITFTVKENSVVKDITGYTFEFTVNIDKNPPDATDEQFRVSGVITDAVNGAVEFRPTSANTDLTPKRYFYDVQSIDGSGYKRTLVKGDFHLEQDVNKA